MDFYSTIKHYGWHDLDPDVAPWKFWEAKGLTESDFWAPLGFDFWEGLEWMPDGREILNVIEQQVGRPNVFLCSSPCLTPGCTSGKARWVERNLPAYARRLLLTDQKYVFAGPDKILVDDHDPNLEKFALWGGSICSVPRPWNEMGRAGRPTVESVVKRLERLVQK